MFSYLRFVCEKKEVSWEKTVVISLNLWMFNYQIGCYY